VEYLSLVQGVIVEPVETNVSANPLPFIPVHDVFHRKQFQEIPLGKLFSNNEGKWAGHDHDIGSNILCGYYSIPGDTLINNFQRVWDRIKIDRVASPGQHGQLCSSRLHVTAPAC